MGGLKLDGKKSASSFSIPFVVSYIKVKLVTFKSRPDEYSSVISMITHMMSDLTVLFGLKV